MIPLDTLFSDHQLYHSDFQMDALITVRAGGTQYGCYKQALRELWKRYRGLRELYLQRELLVIDLDELDKATAGDQFEVRRRTVRLAAKRLSLREIEKNIADTEREFLRFYSQACGLKDRIGNLDSSKRAELDREMWEHRIKSTAAIDLMTSGSLRPTTVESIQACPPDMRSRLTAAIATAAARSELINWYLSFSADIPETCQIPASNVRGLVEC